MFLTTAWLRAWIYLGCISGWTAGARPQFDTSTNMGLVLVPADAEVDSVIFRLRATDQDVDFPLIFDIIAAVQPIVRAVNLPCTHYNKVCQANVILTRRLVPGRVHDFAVRVRDSKGDSNSMQATISVTNATTPRDMIFPHVPSIIMVPEDTKPGKELDYLLVRANPWHGKPVYIELWQPKELFTIRQRQTPTQTRGVIELIGELDFETQSMYTLTMYATDPYTEVGKDTRNIAGVHVVVIVQDVQDVPPVFTVAPPLTRVNNSVKPGDVILRVHAEDGDKGTPREVTYGLISEGNPFIPFFNISESTGEIILTRPLDELTQITHVGAPILLTVVAEEVRRSRDEPPGQSSTVELGLLLGEPGNSPPYFESDSYMAWMDENSAPGTAVMFDKPYLTRVRDEDIGKTGVFALKLGNNNGTFEITPTVAERVADFMVTVRDNTLMDYEIRKTLQFMIIAQEVGPATNLSTSVPVTILLRDVNDNPPEFEKDVYEVTLAENVLPGTRVIQVHASDKDTGLSGSIRYTGIIGPGSETLTMDSETGSIVVARGSQGLDREVTASLKLSVEARDENGKGLRSTVPLIVNLLDVNDNAPIFDKSVYEFVLNSGLTNFTSPAFIKAVDADAEPPNNEVRYELVHGNYENKFHLDEVTGELILKEPVNKPRRRRNNAYDNFATKFRNDFLQTLNAFQKIGVSTDKPFRIWKNRKKRASDDVLYTLTVRAYDLGVPHRSNTAKVQIITAAPMGALTLMLVVPAENLDPVRTAATLKNITGGDVTIEQIRPYDQPSQPGDRPDQNGKRSLVVARVEPTLTGTFLVDVETIYKSLVANGMGIVPVGYPNTNSADESLNGVTVGGSVGNGVGGGSSVGGTTDAKDGGSGGSVIAVTVSSVNLGNEGDNKDTGKGTDGGTGGHGRDTGANTDDNTGEGSNGQTGGSTDIGTEGGKVGGSGVGIGSETGGGPSDGTGGSNGDGASGGINGSGAASEGITESISAGTAGSLDRGNPGGPGGGTAIEPGDGATGHKDESSVGGTVVHTGVNAGTNFNEINKTTSRTENEDIVYKAENKLLLWLLILLGLLMLLALLVLILCCICPGCPFYMAPRKRRVHSFESVNHPDARPKRHLRRKQVNPVKVEWSGKKQAWSADPMRRNWQFNRRNTKNRGLASLPGDIALAETQQALPQEPSLRLRDGPPSWGAPYPVQKRKDDRLYVEDVEAGRTYDTEDVDSLRRHEMERGSDVLRHSYHHGDEASRFPREQHFYRDGNAEVLRLVTGGHLETDNVSPQAQRPTTLVNEQQVLGYRNDGKDILLRRFIEDQKMRQHQDVHGSVQEICMDGLESRRQMGEHFLQKHEVIMLPRNLELDRRPHREERHPSVQRLIIDHGSIDDDEELKARSHQLEAQEANLQQQRKVAAAMLVGTVVAKATEKPAPTNLRTVTVEQNGSSLNIPTYAIHDVELAKQNALLTQLLMDREARNVGVPGLDPGSYLETQSLPGQVAIATQTDRTTATQTDNYAQVRSRSDNDESEEEIRSRRKSKSKKRFGAELRRSRSLWMRSPIQEETRSFSETRTSLLRRKAKEAREGRRATLEPEVLREISDSLDEQASTPSLEETRVEKTQPSIVQTAKYRSDELENLDDEEEGKLSEVPIPSSPDISKNKYHRRSHAKVLSGEASIAQGLGSSIKKLASAGRSKTSSQMAGMKSADSKKARSTSSEKKESDALSADKDQTKKKSIESHSNNNGKGSKKESEAKQKTQVKSASKSGMNKSVSEKSIEKNKPREKEDAPVPKKRMMLRHQKAKKVSTESSEFEEFPRESRQLSLKAKSLKESESTSSSSTKQNPVKGKKANTLSDGAKSRSSETDLDQLPKRDEKQSDSIPSTEPTGQEMTKRERTTAANSKIQETTEAAKYSTKIVEGLVAEQNPSEIQAEDELRKLPSSTVPSPKLNSDDAQTGDQTIDTYPVTVQDISDKSEGLLSQLKSEVAKPSTTLMENQLKPIIHDELEAHVEIQKPAKNVLSKVDSDILQPGESSSPKKELVVSNNENLLHNGTDILDKPDEIDAEASGSKKSTLLIEQKPAASLTEVLGSTDKVADNLEAARTLVPTVSKPDENISFIQKEVETSNNEVLETGNKLSDKSENVDLKASTSSIKVLPIANQLESSISKIIPTIEKIQREPKEDLPKSDFQAVESDLHIVTKEEQPELSAKEVSPVVLQPETMRSPHESQVASEEAEDRSVPSDAMKTVIPDPGGDDQTETITQDTSKSTTVGTERKTDVKTGSIDDSVGSTDTGPPAISHEKDIPSPLKSSHEQSDSFVIIGKSGQIPGPIPATASQFNEEKRSDMIGVRNGSPSKELRNKLQHDRKNERKKNDLEERMSVDLLEVNQRTVDKSPLPQHKYKSVNQSDNEQSPTKEKEKVRNADEDHISKEAVQTAIDGKSPKKKSSHAADEDGFPKIGSPSFYVLSSESSAEGFVPDEEISHAQSHSDQSSFEKATTLVPDISNLPTSTDNEPRQKRPGQEKLHDTEDNLIAGLTHSRPSDLAETRSGEWDRQQIHIGDISSDSPDNARPYQTPRHRSRNRTGNGNEAANLGLSEMKSQLFQEEGDFPQGLHSALLPDQNPEVKKIGSGVVPSDEMPGISTSEMKDYELTPKLIAEEAIRSGLEEIIDSDGLKRESSSQTSSKTSPENGSKRAEASLNVKRRSVRESGLRPAPNTDSKKSALEKTGIGSQSSKKIDDSQEATRTIRPKTEPKGGNPREGDTHPVRPRTQRGKTGDSSSIKTPEVAQKLLKPKVAGKSRQEKQNVEDVKSQDLIPSRPDDGATRKEGYMSRYKQKRDEMERRRKELKEAAEEEQRPRWQRKPVVIPLQRTSGKEPSKKDKLTDGKTPESGTTPKTRRKIKPLANAESEQLRAMVKEGRKLRRAEGGDSDDPTVEIFATEPPAKVATSFQPATQQPTYKYEKIPVPFYLHPPPPPHSSPQVSPQHAGPLDPRRADDDLDSGIAVSLQGGTKLRHQQLLEKKSVFDIAYSEAAPSQLRTDSTTPPS